MAVRELTYVEALNEALREEMRRDDSVIVFGEEVALAGGVYKVTKGLLEEFGPETGKGYTYLGGRDRRGSHWCGACRP
jgi:hypothetical protein